MAKTRAVTRYSRADRNGYRKLDTRRAHHRREGHTASMAQTAETQGQHMTEQTAFMTGYRYTWPVTDMADMQRTSPNSAEMWAPVAEAELTTIRPELLGNGWRSHVCPISGTRSSQ